MICPSCGKNVSANQEFCQYCGAQTQFSSRIRYFPKEVPVSVAQKPVLQPASRQDDTLREKDRTIAAQTETIAKQKETIAKQKVSVSTQKETIAKQKRLIALFAALAAVALLAACALGVMFALRACKSRAPAEEPVPEKTEQATVPPTEGTEDTETPAPSGDPIAVETADPSETESPAPESPVPDATAPDATATESPAPTEKTVEVAEENPTETPFTLLIKGGKTAAHMETVKEKECLRVDLYLDGQTEKDLFSSMTFTILYDEKQLSYWDRVKNGPIWNAAKDGWTVSEQKDGEADQEENDKKLVCTLISTDGKLFGQDKPILSLYFAIGEGVTEGSEIAVTIADAIEAKVLREGSEAPEDCKVKADTEPFIFAAEE